MIISVCGPMFSGKTKKLLEYVDKFNIQGKNYLFFKPKIDNRYVKGVKARFGNKVIEAISLNEINEIFKYMNDDVEVIIIDEAQFFDKRIVDVVQSLNYKGKMVIIAGLDKDINGRPFGEMGGILAIADEVIKLKAICHKCRKEASFSIRFNENNEVDKTIDIIIDKEGIKQRYEARCTECFYEDYYLN